MSINVLVYDEATGDIIAQVSGEAAQVEANIAAGQAGLEVPAGYVARMDGEFVDVTASPPVLAEREPFVASLPAEVAAGTVLSLDLPAGTVVAIDQWPAVVADEEPTELEFAAMGVVVVEVLKAGFVPIRQIVTVI